MSVEDFRINAFVRQVLSRNWVNLQAVKYGAVAGVVYFHGRFEKLRIKSEDLDPQGHAAPEVVAEDLALLQRVEKEVRRNPMVNDVVFRFENFRKNRGTWIVLEGR
jgi:hypothetical protein